VRVSDVDVIIAGAGPTGLMLASELCLAGLRPLVLERQPQLRQTPKANGFGGQITQLLHYRGLMDRFEAASIARPRPRHSAPRYPFGGVHVDFSCLAEQPLEGLYLPQPRLERLLHEHACELGAEIHRGHELVGVSQDDDAVTADVRGPDRPYQLSARYLVGCDGGRSRVRELVGIPFPGTTYPEVNRLTQAAVAAPVTRLDNGDLHVPGLGRLPAGFTRTDHGVFGFGSLTPEMLLIQTTEDQPVDVDDDTPMTLGEMQESIHRVLGVDIPLANIIRLSRYQFQGRHIERYRDGQVLLAGDAAHLFHSTGVGLNAGMLDAVNLAWKLAATIDGWAPAGLLDTYHDERRIAGERTLLHTQAQAALRRGHDPAAEALRNLFCELLTDEQPLQRIGALIAGTDIRYRLPKPNEHALTGTFVSDLPLRTDQGTTRVAELMHTARPILLDLADRPELRATARDWYQRIDIHTAETDHQPADAILIRPDAHIAWAATIDEPADTATLKLREALSCWFGPPSKRP
jgi:2-polyprenyl-6-methoxyphenol hydroxylase-like FAD-dependent oxidoreductase